MLHKHYNYNLRSFIISKGEVLNPFDISKISVVCLKSVLFGNKKRLNLVLFWLLYVLTGRKPVLSVINKYSPKAVFLVHLIFKEACIFLYSIVLYSISNLKRQQFLDFKNNTIFLNFQELFWDYFEFINIYYYLTLQDFDLFKNVNISLEFSFFNNCGFYNNKLLVQMLQIPVKLSK